MSMTFQEIYTEVINLRFNGNNAASAKHWVNQAYAEAWFAQDWTFAWATANVAITSGSSALGSLPSDFGNTSYLWSETGTPIKYLTPQQFYKTFYGATDTGYPLFYTVVNGSISLGPTPNYSSSAYQLVYRRAFTTLVNDSDVPLLPAEYHYMLVHGGLRYGLATVNDFTYAMQAEMFNELLASMGNQYLSDHGGTLQYESDFIGLNDWRGTPI